MQEATAYAELYQEGMARMSKDGGISIMQGRAVGGSTLINWASSFRTPPATLEHWANKHEVSGLSEQTLKPWFEHMEKRLGIEAWPIAANANNEVIKRGCQVLGYDWAVIPRNVRDCLSLGFCGMGCPASASGKVELRSGGSPVLDYQMTDFTWQAMRRAYHSMAEIQFAAGAEKVFPVHNQADYMTSLAETQRVIDGLDLAIHRARLGSAHVMGGCALSDNPKLGVTNSWGVHHQLENLSVHDGSVFPTSIGANPQLSIYAIAALFNDQLLKKWV